MPMNHYAINDRLMVKCDPWYRCSAKIGILEGTKVVFYRYCTKEETNRYHANIEK